MAKSIMVQGTGSGVGKSVITAALCRIFKQDGYSVSPFKSQNMALNSFPTAEGLEMGRAQVVQAQAAGITPTVDMNPILIKPSADCLAQLIVRGKPEGNCTPVTYYEQKKRLRKIVKTSYQSLADQYEIIVIEGAGSPAEINLRANDIVNMHVAKMSASPVLLVADIDLGGVFAWIYGTIKLLTPSERKLVKGVIINKFRGDIELLKPGIVMLEKRINIPVLGVIPYLHDMKIEEEDSVAWQKQKKQQTANCLDVAVIYLPHVSNFTDFDALELTPGVNLRYLKKISELGEPDVIIIPGSKSTISDLEALRRSGLAQAVTQAAKKGAVIVGICGGFQMLGEEIFDELNIESSHQTAQGLGLLKLVTTLKEVKTIRQITGCGVSGFAKDKKVAGYEIHHGKTTLKDGKPLFELADGSHDGATDKDGKVWGTYLHGVFDEKDFRIAFLKHTARLRGKKIEFGQTVSVDEFRNREFDKLASEVRSHIDMKKIYQILEGENKKHGDD